MIGGVQPLKLLLKHPLPPRSPRCQGSYPSRQSTSFRITQSIHEQHQPPPRPKTHFWSTKMAPCLQKTLIWLLFGRFVSYYWRYLRILILSLTDQQTGAPEDFSRRHGLSSHPSVFSSMWTCLLIGWRNGHKEAESHRTCIDGSLANFEVHLQKGQA